MTMSPQGHYGLCGMFERVESVGGHTSITNTNTSTDVGTTVEIIPPLIEAPLNRYDSSKSINVHLLVPS